MIKTTLEVKGMACGMCENHVNEAIRNAFKVKKVTSSHTKNQKEKRQRALFWNLCRFFIRI